ncbi:MAG: hypothetical protein ACI4RA_04165 [Kiritimatiellia bacterium]
MADDVEMTPITPADGESVPPKVAPFAAPAAAPSPNPVAAAPAAVGGPTIKLKPVIRRPTIHKPTIGGAKPPVAAPAAKKATQNLKSVTGPIPAQATLKKTGIIAEGIITPQQQQAAKSKTSRISLESAIGVAPAKDGPAPLKTIRLRRPTDLKPAAEAPKPLESAAAAPQPIAPAHETPAAPAAEPAADDAGVTQKKTLKLHRPGGVGIKRPAIGIGQSNASEGNVADLGGGEVPELATLSPLEMGETQKSEGSGIPTWLAAVSLAVSIAALLVAGFLVYNLVEEARHSTGAGANEMAFLDF